MLKIITIIFTIVLSYIIGILYNKYYSKLNLEKGFPMKKVGLYLFQSVFLIVSWLSLLISYEQSSNSVLIYILFMMPLYSEIVGDLIDIKEKNKEQIKEEDKNNIKKLRYIIFFFLILINIGIGINFVALINIKILSMIQVQYYSLFSMFLGIVWIIGKIGYFACKE